MKKNVFSLILIFSFMLLLFPQSQWSEDAPGVFTIQDTLGYRYSGEALVSPDGKWIAYTIGVPRKADDEPGSYYTELYVATVGSNQIRPFITGKVSIHGLQWSPDCKRISFVTSRGEKAKSQVWAIAVDGGEALQLTCAENGVYGYRWHPSGKSIAYTSTCPKSDKDKKLDKMGYGFIYYEENLKHVNLYFQDLSTEKAKAEKITNDITVRDFVFNSDGTKIAFSGVKENLVDHDYMFKRIYLLDPATKKYEQLTDNPGKLGSFKFSPDNTKLVYTRALDRKDHAVSQVFVVDIKTKEEKNLTIPDFRGHVSWAIWKDAKTVLYYSGEGVYNTLSLVPAAGGDRQVILNSKETGVSFRGVSFSKDFKHAAFSGSTPENPGDLYYWDMKKKKISSLTHINPWIKERKLGKQEVIRYAARDEKEIEGILIYPVDFKKGEKYPLVVFVHGGPESHYSNQWCTYYSEQGQVMAGRGYFVFYPNYRASTGYGVNFALEGYKDPAGKEFDDIADGIDHLIKEGLVDKDRVGLGGGSYGGFAAAWFGTYYTEKVRAVCMFVGISDIVSKRGTTDIPYEELYVHSGEKLEKQWDLDLKRSPIYYAHQSKSAVLIYGGAADPRVHPSQSLELHRRLKMNNHPAVRLVQYPGEGHGNRRQPGRIDVLIRTTQWFDWYVKDKKPLDGPMPPLDISDQYGFDLK